jgi:hypothetical protein
MMECVAGGIEFMIFGGKLSEGGEEMFIVGFFLW